MVEKIAESSLSSWGGPYVTQMLGRGAALANMPYQAYTGPLTAGQSDLQNKAFQGLGALTMPTTMGKFTPTSFTTGTAAKDYMSPYTANLTAPTAKMGGFTPTSFTSGTTATDYMNPYLQAALAPQYAAARRQSEIQQQELQKQYGRAGAYGGSRQGVAEGELQRGLLDRIAGITGTGYQDAYTQGRDQFNTEQDRARQSQDMVNRYGFDIANAFQDAGETQRTIEQQGMSADLAQFTEERGYPQNQTLFMQALLDGLPLETQSYSYSEPSGLQSLAGGVNDVTSILDELGNLGGGNKGTGPAGGYSQPTQSAALQGQYNYYVAMGETPAQAMAKAKADLGIG